MMTIHDWLFIFKMPVKDSEIRLFQSRLQNVALCCKDLTFLFIITSAGSSGASSGNEVCQRGVCTGPCSLQIPASSSSRRSVSQRKDFL